MHKEYNIYTSVNSLTPVSTIRANSAESAIKAYATLTKSDLQNLHAKAA